jgi:PQQ-like domain
VTAVPGVVFVGAGTVFTALSSATGQILWRWTVADGQPIYGAPTVSNGVLYAGDMNGNLYAFSTPGGASVYPAPVVPCAATIPVAAEGMTPGEKVNFYLDSTSSTPLASVTAGADGSAYTTVPVTAGPRGSHTLIAVGQTSGTTASHPFATVASICLAQSQGPQGSVETVTGTGFGANEHVTLYFGTGQPPLPGTSPSGTVVGQATAGSKGAFQGTTAATFKVPSAPYAPQYVEAVGSLGSTATSSFIITASVAGSVSSGPPGTVVRLSGVDFNPQWTVTATGNCSPVSCGAPTVLGTGFTTPNGQFQGLAVTIPDVPAGGYLITVTGTSGTSAALQFSVTGG